jgi:hypothetical protein
MTKTNTTTTRRYVASSTGAGHYIPVTIRRTLARDLKVGDVVSTMNGRFMVTAPVRPGFYGRGIRVTTVNLNRLGSPDHTHVDADLYFLHVED